MDLRVRPPVVAWIGFACSAALIAGVLAVDGCSSPASLADAAADASTAEAAPPRVGRDADVGIGRPPPDGRTSDAPIESAEAAGATPEGDEDATFERPSDPGVQPPGLARGRLVGSVLDPDGVAVPGAVVYLVRRDEDDLQRHTGFEMLTADDEGAFQRDGIFVGRYELYCNMGETRDLGLSEPSLARTPRGFVVVDVAPDQETRATIRLQILPQVSGRVTGAGLAIADALVLVVRPSPWPDEEFQPPPPPGSEPEGCWTDERGFYSLFLDRPGEIQLVVASDCTSAVTEPHLTLVWGDVARQDLTLHTGRISGVVRDAETARGIAGAFVELHDGLSGCFVETDADGGFAFSWLRPGSYVVTWSHGDSCPSAPLVVELPADGTVEDLSLPLHRGGSVSGVLSCADGSPVPGDVTVSLSPVGRPGDMSYEITTDRYEFRGLDSGTYELSVEPQRVGDDLVHAPRASVVVVRGESVRMDLVLTLTHSPQDG